MIFTATAWTILFVLLWWLPQNVQHEGAHSIAHKTFGASITAFVPYPTNNDNEFSLKFWEKGFTWAHMRYRQPADRPLTPREQAICSIAPQATNTVLLIALYALYAAVDMHWIVVALYITNYVDGMWNLGTFYKPEPEPMFKYSDGWKFQKYAKLDKWVCRVGAGVWHVGFAALLLLPL